jgi:hypothetical protein
MHNPDQNNEAVALRDELRHRAESEGTPSAGDVELIRWALSLSLEERLAVLQDFVDTFWTPQHG